MKTRTQPERRARKSKLESGGQTRLVLLSGGRRRGRWRRQCIRALAAVEEVGEVAVASEGAASAAGKPGNPRLLPLRRLVAIAGAASSPLPLMRHLYALMPLSSWLQLKQQIQAPVSAASVQSSTEGPKSQQLNTQSERSSPARFKVLRTLSAPSPSRFQLNPQSESSGSSPASGSLQLERDVGFSPLCSVPSVLMDRRRMILLSLFNMKFTMKRTHQWKATDDVVLQRVAKCLKEQMSIDELRKYVVEMECAVKLDLEKAVKIVEDRDTYLEVFNYVMPDFVACSPTVEASEEDLGTDLRSLKKMKMISCQSDSSMGEQFSNLMNNKEDLRKLFCGELNMMNCTKKAESCGFDEDTLLEAIDLLTANWEYRQA